jgi:hypothetical protein
VDSRARQLTFVRCTWLRCRQYADIKEALTEYNDGVFPSDAEALHTVLERVYASDEKRVEVKLPPLIELDRRRQPPGNLHYKLVGNFDGCTFRVRCSLTNHPAASHTRPEHEHATNARTWWVPLCPLALVWPTLLMAHFARSIVPSQPSSKSAIDGLQHAIKLAVADILAFQARLLSMRQHEEDQEQQQLQHDADMDAVGAEPPLRVPPDDGIVGLRMEQLQRRQLAAGRESLLARVRWRLVAVALTQREYFSVLSLVLSRVLFLGVLSSLIVAGALVSIQVGLTARRRQSELAKLRQLLASGGPRSLTRTLEQRDGGNGLSESSVGRALDELGVMANDGACTGSQAVRSQALPEPADAANEARVTDGAAAALRAPPPNAAPPPRPLQEVELVSMLQAEAQPTVVEPVARGTMLGRARGDSLVEERDVVFAAMSGPAATPAAATNPMTDFISRRLSGALSGPEASQRLEA